MKEGSSFVDLHIHVLLPTLRPVLYFRRRVASFSFAAYITKIWISPRCYPEPAVWQELVPLGRPRCAGYSWPRLAGESSLGSVASLRRPAFEVEPEWYWSRNGFESPPLPPLAELSKIEYTCTQIYSKTGIISLFFLGGPFFISCNLKMQRSFITYYCVST